MSNPLSKSVIIALLGSSGFIGTHVAKSCASAGIPLFPIDRWDGDSQRFDRQLYELRGSNPDSEIVLIQAAWYSTSNPDYRTSLENMDWVEISKAILAVCEKHKIVFAGLGTCLEKKEIQNDIYSSSKLEVIEYLSRNRLETDWIWFQLYYVYSLDYLKPAVVKKASEAVRSGSLLRLQTPNDSHDFIEVRDAANAIVHAIVMRRRGRIEVGTGRTIEVAKFLTTLFPAVRISKEEFTKERISYQSAASVGELVETGWQIKHSIS